MNKKTIIIIVSVVVAVAIAAALTISLLSNVGNDGGKNEDTSSNVSTGESTGSNSDTNSTISIPKANNDITTFIGGNVTAEKVSKVSVPIFVSSNKGFMAAFGSLKYDTSVLKFIGYKDGDLFSEYEFLESNGEIKFMIEDNGDITKDGVLYYVEFEIISTNPTTTTIEFAIADNMVANKSAQYVKFETINGSVTIK